MTDTITSQNIDLSSWDTLYSTLNPQLNSYKSIIRPVKDFYLTVESKDVLHLTKLISIAYIQL